MESLSQLWDSMEITESFRFREPVDEIKAARSRYERVSGITLVPWQVIGVIHSREADCDFHCHLHNGDPLTGRTIHVPKGRPLEGDARSPGRIRPSMRWLMTRSRGSEAGMTLPRPSIGSSGSTGSDTGAWDFPPRISGPGPITIFRENTPRMGSTIPGPSIRKRALPVCSACWDIWK